MANSTPKQGDLVTVTLTYGGKTFSTHGRWTGSRELAVEVHERGTYTATPEEARREGMDELIATWLTIYSETGNMMDAPAGSRGLWGAQERNSDFRLLTGEWMLGMYDLKVREDSPNVRIEPLTDEGRRYIEANLSTDKRRSRLEEKLRALAPELALELDDVLYRVAEDARAEERRNQYDSDF